MTKLCLKINTRTPFLGIHCWQSQYMHLLEIALYLIYCMTIDELANLFALKNHHRTWLTYVILQRLFSSLHGKQEVCKTQMTKCYSFATSGVNICCQPSPEPFHKGSTPVWLPHMTSPTWHAPVLSQVRIYSGL